MRRATTIIVALALVPVIAAAATSRARYLMGTVCEVAVTGSESESELAFAEAERVEELLSTWKPASELSRVNRGEAQPSPELRALLDEAFAWSKKTNGAFEPRIRPLIDLWRTREEGALPDTKAIAEVLTRCRPERSEGPPATGSARGKGLLRFAQDDTCGYEEGAFGKGYALDRMLAKLTAREVVIDFGGQLMIRGTRGVAIAHPAHREKPVLAFTLTNASLSTSSGSEKTFVVAGETFSHILDPRTGHALPPRGSASVVADRALDADILSTALYVMGEDEGLRWADAHGVAAIFIAPTNQVRLSAAARERVRDLELLDENFFVKD